MRRGAEYSHGVWSVATQKSRLPSTSFLSLSSSNTRPLPSTKSAFKEGGPVCDSSTADQFPISNDNWSRSCSITTFNRSHSRVWRILARSYFSATVPSTKLWRHQRFNENANIEKIPRFGRPLWHGSKAAVYAYVGEVWCAWNSPKMVSKVILVIIIVGDTQESFRFILFYWWKNKILKTW